MRSDGSTWQVTDFQCEEGRILVEARRAPTEADPRTVSFDRPVSLWPERLDVGDRLVWRR